MRSLLRSSMILLCSIAITAGCGSDKNESPSAPESGSQTQHTITLINALPWDMGLVLNGSDITVALSGNTSTLGGIPTANHAWELWENSTGDWYPTTNNGTLYIDRGYTLRFYDGGGYAAYSWEPTARYGVGHEGDVEVGEIVISRDR